MAKKKTTRRNSVEIAKEELRREFDEKLQTLKESTEIKIKERAMFEKQSIGQMLDAIVDDAFIKELRGNGKPGIFERIRSGEATVEEIKDYMKQIRGNGKPGLMEQIRKTNKSLHKTWVFLVLLFLAMLGGQRYGIGLKEIGDYFLGEREVIQIDISETSEDTNKLIEIEGRIENLEKRMKNLTITAPSSIDEEKSSEEPSVIDNINKGIKSENQENKIE